MNLCDFFDQFFETIFTQANFSPTDKQQMKTSLTLIWLKRVSEKITPLLGQEESQIVAQLMQKSNDPINPPDPKLAERLTLFLQDATRNQQVVDLYFTEAEKLLSHIAAIFKEHATPIELQAVRTKLKELSASINSA